MQTDLDFYLMPIYCAGKEFLKDSIFLGLEKTSNSFLTSFNIVQIHLKYLKYGLYYIF